MEEWQVLYDDALHAANADPDTELKIHAAPPLLPPEASAIAGSASTAMSTSIHPIRLNIATLPSDETLDPEIPSPA